jgi:CheY-like chemotaxis protein
MSEQRRGTVLCVDDDEQERQALAWVFQGAGLDVEVAATGGAALRLAARHPGLIVLDVNLPDIDGLEVCRQIKAHPATAAIPVLYLSGALAQPSDVSRALAEGADGCLTKPVAPQVLLAWTRALLKGHRREAVQDNPVPFMGAPPGTVDRERSGRVKANGKPRHDWDHGNKNHSPAGLPPGQGVFRNPGGAGAGNTFLGIGVALCLEACLAVLVVLPLCGVAVPRWAVLSALAPALGVVLALCGRARGRLSP